MEPALLAALVIACLSFAAVLRPSGRCLAAAGSLAVAALVVATVDGSARAEVPPPSARLVARQVAPSPEARQHTVVAGECLWRIAKHYLAVDSAAEPTSAEIARFWPSIYEANRQVIGDDPDLILVGQVLAIPEV